MNFHYYQRKFWTSLQRNWRPLLGLCFLALIIYLIFRQKLPKITTTVQPVFISKKTEVESPSVKKAETVSFPKVKVEVHMESRCPDTTNFIEHQLWTVWGDLKGIIDLEIIPFGKASCLPRDNDFLCSCQHLERECLLNQLMNCVIDHVNKSVEAYLPVIRCLQGKDMDSAADRCLRAATITSRPLIECANGKKGRQLHAEAGKKTKALDPSMYFVPWVLINGKREERALGDFKGVVCDTYTGRPKPEICGH